MVPSWYQNEKNSILGSFFREQALALTKRGHKVWVADATYQPFDNIRSPRMLKLCKYKDEALETFSYIAPAVGIARTASGGVNWYYRRLKKIYKRMVKEGISIDVIQAHSFYPAGTASLRLSREFNIPLVVTEHNSLVLREKIHPKRISALRDVVEHSGKFICVSEALKKAVKNLTNTEKEILVIPNSVDSSLEFINRKAQDVITFVSVGNLISGKRFDLTLRAFAKAKESIEDARLLIVGDGVLREELIKLSKNLGISSAVTFTGRVSREEIGKIYNEAHIFVLPSDAETFGVVYIEALACGCPVIATRNGGAEEIVNEDRGILVDKDDEKQLSDAMVSMYERYSSFDLKRLSEDCLGEFGEDVLSKRTEDVYRQVLSCK